MNQPIVNLPERARKYGELFHKRNKLKGDLRRAPDSETRARITHEIIAFEQQMTAHTNNKDRYAD